MNIIKIFLLYFKMVKSVGPTVQWPEGEDVDPNRLYLNSIDC